MKTTDRKLIDKFLNGDQEAFELIVERWERKTLNLAYRLTSDMEEALDIRQLAFIKVYTKLSSFNGRAELSTWLYRIVINLCRDRLRARKARDCAMRKIAIHPEAPIVECASEQKETARIVAKAVASLPEAEREAVVLRHYHNRSFPEIAAIVGSNPSTVKSRMARGLKNLRAILKEFEQ